MKAAFYARTGPAQEVFEVRELNDPLPGPREVRVKLACSGINPADVKRRSGEACRRLEFPLIIPHSDGAGVIDLVGPGVPSSRIGQRVWTWNAQWRRPFGTAAEYTIVPAEQAVRLPEQVSYETGASLGVPALTAHYAVSLAGCLPGQPVYISGGAGAVGRLAIQLAKVRGAFVIATVSSEEKRSVALSSGADLVINYRTEDVAGIIGELTRGRGVDRLIEVDLGANISTILKISSQLSTVIVYGSVSNMRPEVPVLPLQLLNASVRFISGSEQGDGLRRAAIEEVSQLLESERLSSVTAALFPLDEIARAHELVESGTAIGKVVVTIAGHVPGA